MSTVLRSLCPSEWLESPLVDGRKVGAFLNRLPQNIISPLLSLSKDTTKQQLSSGLFPWPRSSLQLVNTTSLSEPSARMGPGKGILIWTLRLSTSSIWARHHTQTTRSVSLIKTKGAGLPSLRVLCVLNCSQVRHVSILAGRRVALDKREGSL